jgi:CHAP domain-containing protein
VSGRHIKDTLRKLYTTEIKTVGGAFAGAALAGAIAASATVTTPNTAPATGSHLASQRTLTDVAVLRADDRRAPSHHEAHSRHQAHLNHKARSEKKAKSSKHEARGRRVSSGQLIGLAKAQLGISENRSGETKFNKWYMGDSRSLRTLKRDGGSRAGYKDAAWCDMFVSWIGNRLGISGTVGFDAWAVKHAEWFKDHGRWGHQPRPGAVTFFGWNGDKINDIEHVGFTIKDNHDGTIQTIEGNTHNTVAIRKRKKSFVVGYGYPNYKK